MQQHTDEKMRLLAELQLATDERIDEVADLLNCLIEADIREGRFAPGASVLHAEIDQEKARARDARAHRARLRKLFNLPTPENAKTSSLPEAGV
jgi:hypothetical protein